MNTIDKTIAIIPARGGSKRLPRKNIVKILGKPVLSYTIESADKTGLFDQIIVSTEDKEIAEVAQASGADVFKRSSGLSSDTATMNDVMKDVLEQFKSQFDAYPRYFCCLLATSILRFPEDISSSYALLEPDICDFVLTYKEYESSPHEALKVDEQGKLSPMWPDIMFQTRWERPKLVKDAGSVYWLNTLSFLEQDTFFGDNLRGYLLPHERAIDLDVQADLDLMEYYMNKKINEGKNV
jgi:pseudaminic acid cytidylyltransferase